MTEWKSIESAPRAGDVVLMELSDGRTAVAGWSPEAYRTGDSADTSVAHPGWVIYGTTEDGELRIQDRIRPDDVQPVSWRPAPTPEEAAHLERELERLRIERDQAQRLVAAKLQEHDVAQAEHARIKLAEAEEQQQRSLLGSLFGEG